MIGKAEATHTTTRVTKAFLKYDMLKDEAVSRRIGWSIKIEMSGSADCFANPSVSKYEASSTSRRTYSDSSDEVEQEPVLQGRTEKGYEGERRGKENNTEHGEGEPVLLYSVIPKKGHFPGFLPPQYRDF